MEVLKFCAHSKTVLDWTKDQSWLPGARYTNLRDISKVLFEGIGFIDIDWKKYNFEKHLEACQIKRPMITMARDIESIFDLDSILKEAEILAKHSTHVAIVPKDPLMNNRIQELIPEEYILGYSVPTRYGGTKVSLSSFNRPVHLLGGRPDVQRHLAEKLNVFSLDCNRFTLDARYGKYFNGRAFIKHPKGGYKNCIIDSAININKIWMDYKFNNTLTSLNKEASNG